MAALAHLDGTASHAGVDLSFGRNLQSASDCSYTAGEDCLRSALTGEEYAACSTCVVQFTEVAFAVFDNSTQDCAAIIAFTCAVVVACPCLWSCANEFVDFNACLLNDGQLNQECAIRCTVNGTSVGTGSSGTDGANSGGGGGGSSGASSSPTSRAYEAAAVAILSSFAAAGLASAN